MSAASGSSGSSSASSTMPRPGTPRSSGTVQEVLVEGPSRTDPSVLRGRTRGGKALNFTGAAPAGSLVDVTVTGSTSQTLSGRQAAPVAALTACP